jgi:hypothetical protein
MGYHSSSNYPAYTENTENVFIDNGKSIDVKFFDGVITGKKQQTLLLFFPPSSAQDKAHS